MSDRIGNISWGETFRAVRDGYVEHRANSEEGESVQTTCGLELVGAQARALGQSRIHQTTCATCFSTHTAFAAALNSKVLRAKWRYSLTIWAGMFVLGSAVAALAVALGDWTFVSLPFWRTEIWIALASAAMTAAWDLFEGALGRAQMMESAPGLRFVPILVFGACGFVLYLHGLDSTLDGFVLAILNG